MIESAIRAASPRCPRCHASRWFGVAPAATSGPIRRAAVRRALAELGPPPDAHPFNYGVALLAFVFVCIAIPGTWRDFVRAFVLELALILLALGVNRTLLREHVACIDAHRARLRARGRPRAAGAGADRLRRMRSTALSYDWPKNP